MGRLTTSGVRQAPHGIVGHRSQVSATVGQAMIERRSRWIVEGAIVGVIGSPFLAALTALVFRFPVPFYAYVSGARGMVPAFLGAIFYEALGGIVVQALLGGLGGVTGAHRGWPAHRQMHKLCIVFALICAELGVLTLATLDWMIGPW
jgi:hypothetical protein